MKILVADDNASVRKVLGAMLAAWGYTVVTARDGRQAWDILQQDESPQLAILDWMMPEIDGIDICRLLRSHQTAFPKYVMLLTCRGQKEDVVTGLEAGADDYLTKPFEADELRARVDVGKRYLELQNSLRDRMSELHRQGTELRRSNRALLLLNRCSHLLATATSEDRLLNDLCHEMINIAGYRLAWIGIAEAPSSLRLIPAAYAGSEKISLAIIRFAWNDVDPARSMSGKAMLSGRPVIARNIKLSGQFSHMLQELPSPDFNSLISIPFNQSPALQGTLNIYAHEIEAFDTEEVKLMTMLADNLAYGINAIRTERERRQFATELQRERDQAQLYLDVAGVLLVALDSSGNISLVNPKGCTILGPSRDEILGRNWFNDFMPAHSRQKAWEEYERLMRSGAGFREYFEQTICTSDRTERVLAIHASLLRDTDNKITGLLISGEDITEKKQSEKALRTSEENYRTLFDRMVSTSSALSAYRSSADEG